MAHHICISIEVRKERARSIIKKGTDLSYQAVVIAGAMRDDASLKGGVSATSVEEWCGIKAKPRAHEAVQAAL